jgi:hypothetical protein
MKCALLLVRDDALYVGEADAVTAVDVAREPDGPLLAVGRPVQGFHGDGIACRPAAGQARPRPGNRVLDGTGIDGTGQIGTGLSSTGLSSTGLSSTGLSSTGLGDQPDVPHLVG